MSVSKTLFAFNISLFFFILLIAATPPNLFSLQHAYSQIESSPDDTLTRDIGSSNVTAGGSINASGLSSNSSSSLVERPSTLQNSNTSVSSIGGNTSEDFRAIREQYLSSWERLKFGSSFDTFIEPYSSVNVYGGYEAKRSNVFQPGDPIQLYVEPVGFAHKENIDPEGNPIYSVNITSNITVSDSQGNVLGTQGIPFEVDNSYSKVTEVFLLLRINQNPPFPEGEYIATYHFTDGTTGESFDLVKNFRVGEVVTVR